MAQAQPQFIYLLAFKNEKGTRIESYKKVPELCGREKLIGRLDSDVR